MFAARALQIFALANLLACAAPAQTPVGAGTGWPTYGGDPGGTRSSQSTQITRANLDKLHPVWTFHTHALDRDPGNHVFPSFENTPVLSGDTLFLTSPFNVVFALDARTGVERWHFDPKIARQRSGGIVASRGVALWPVGADMTTESGLCTQRIFEGTLDARLISLDARTGQPCRDFGDNGSVDLTQDIHFQNIGSYGMTSPPTVVGNVVICGSVVGDNQQVDPESGAVRGYDAVTGRKLWQWEPLPWAEQQKVRTGAGNTWGVISADPALGLVYLPTGSAAPDIYGGMRPGDNRDANSVVALQAATGRKVWAFQVVHHDVWDYDIASEPILFTWRPNTKQATPAIAVTTKMGMIFLLDRRTGKPLVPVEERPVPQDGAPGEQLSPTQPFQQIPSLSPLRMPELAQSTYHRSAADEEICRKQFASLRYDGIYTPPTLRGSIAYPGNLGGVNWGGAALDPATGILYAGTNRIASATRLVPRHSWEIYSGKLEDLLFSAALWVALIVAAIVLDSLQRRRLRAGWATLVVALACAGVFGGSAIHDHFSPPPRVLVLDHFGYELSPQRKSPYYVERHPILDGRGFNCTPAPWGAMTAVNLNTLTKVWEQPLGTMVPGQRTGAVNFGGPIVTASGLVFTAAAEDPWLRVFDAATGEELHRFALPLPGVATPMTYTLDGRQYVVIAAGGHGDGSPLGDEMVAFALQ